MFRLFKHLDPRRMTGTCIVENTPKLIQSIERSAAILEIIAQEGGAARLQRIASVSGIGKTTAHNILQTLGQLGYVQRRPGDMRYHLGGRILNLARIAGDDTRLRTHLRPMLEAIARESGATAWLAVPSGDEATYLDIVDIANPAMATSGIGRRERLEGSAVGLVFLAFVPGLGKRVLATRANALGQNIRTQIEAVRISGYALDLQAYQAGLHGVAIPWRENGEVRASICLTGSAAQFPRHRLARMAWMMMRHAGCARFNNAE
ncbi:transcriptional regulator [Novacetimonas hansenii]|uniref:Transcriptional regulator n=2 Tax=Novacetimonas hansenii TaxID=436 RepID=A0ABQ0SCB6_NOVHA|nr:putative transcriptional regulator [Novacetimonas hansenii ATCC 23769]GAN83580.1 transcriptional regulator [Novacetimonas hansenii JCM 7643]GBQ54875.1 putative transcriptional regulator [Novacetimonas hansenii NRIC 0243]GEC62876.1 transcriptional regulator [Novacetimonas hansenii]